MDTYSGEVILSVEIHNRGSKTFNPLDTGGLFHCYMLNKSIYYFKGAGSSLLLLFYF